MSCWLLAYSIVTCALLCFLGVNSAALRRLAAADFDHVDKYDHSGLYCFVGTIVISAVFAVGICISTITANVMAHLNEKQAVDMESNFLMQRDQAEELRLRVVELEKIKMHLDSQNKELQQLKKENTKRCLQIIANTEQMLPVQEKLAEARKKLAQHKIKMLEQNAIS